MADVRSLALRPTIRLFGNVDDAMLANFLDQLGRVLNGGDPVALELFTLGGDADVGCRIAAEIRLCRALENRPFAFIGKSNVYSAGITVMAAFTREERYLTRGTLLLVHERSLNKQVDLAGPLSSALQTTQALAAQIEAGMHFEQRGFAELVAGSAVSETEVRERAKESWYLTAEDALARGLVAGLL